MRGGCWFAGQDYWNAKDYYNGLNVGLWMVEDREVGKKLLAFACGDYMRFWALLPEATRAQQQASLKKQVEGNEYGWMEDYEEAEKPLRTTILAGLELTMAPKRVLKRFAPPPKRLNELYEIQLELIKYGGQITHEDYGFWVWSAAKFYLHAGSIAWSFWMTLDMSRTGQFSSLGRDYETGTVLGLEGKVLTKLLCYLSLQDISGLCCVSKEWRRAVWKCFFDHAPTAYKRTGTQINVTWK